MRLKEARECAGMTIKELADATGVSAAAICRYETGKRTPSVRIAKRIAKILSIAWYEILDNRSVRENVS